jgi:Rrf2 family protein
VRVSQRLDYAVRALVLLAMEDEGALVAAGELAQRLRMPRRFVEQQFTALSHAGIVACRRGATGGCALARPASEITATDVVRALHGDILDIPRHSGSASVELWAGAADVLEMHLSGVSIADLARRQRSLDSQTQPMYYI